MTTRGEKGEKENATKISTSTATMPLSLTSKRWKKFPGLVCPTGTGNLEHPPPMEKKNAQAQRVMIF
jgi:hypothetical protein